MEILKKSDFLKIIDKLKGIYYRNCNLFDFMYDNVKNTCILNEKFYTTKTIHNNKISVRPLFNGIAKHFTFFDSGCYWINPKRHYYKIYVDDHEKVRMIDVDNGSLIEFWEYSEVDNSIEMAAFVKSKTEYLPYSIGLAEMTDEKITAFMILEIAKVYSLDIDYRVELERYYYDDSNISKIITYSYDSTRKIICASNKEEFGFIRFSYGGVNSNPEIYIRELIYIDNKLISVSCNNYFDKISR